jgi:hypothetical protein
VVEAGRTVGFVSTMDVLRGLLGLPAAHPQSFPHQALGYTWSDDQALGEVSAAHAPDGPGLIALTHGGAYVPETLMWVEPARNIRQRLTDWWRAPEKRSSNAAAWIERGELRFRFAPLSDGAELSRAWEELAPKIHFGA